jgi:ATP-dependent Clp protease ATP-binding subunit ClpA
MFNDFSKEANQVINIAKQEARFLNHHFIGTENILLGLVEEKQGIASKILKSMGVNATKIRTEVDKIIGRGSGYVGEEIPFTCWTKRVLVNARKQAYQLGKTEVDTEHLLLSLIDDVINKNNNNSDYVGISIRILQQLEVDLDSLYQQIIDYIRTVKQQNYQEEKIQFIDEEIDDNKENYIEKYIENTLLITSPNLEEKVKHLAMMLTGAKQLIAEIETQIQNPQNISSSDVLDAIHQLPINQLAQSSLESIDNLPDLFIRLHALIEGDTKLNSEDIMEARYQLIVLITASKNIGEENWKRKANTAIKILIGTIVQRPIDSHQLSEYRSILPAISKLMVLR